VHGAFRNINKGYPGKMILLAKLVNPSKMPRPKHSSHANKVIKQRQVLPLIGPALEYYNDSARTTELFFRECGSLGGFSYLGSKIIASADPGLNDHILKSKLYRKVDNNKRFARAVGDGLLTSEGKKWVESRRIVQPLLANNDFYSLFVRNTVEIMEETKNRWHQLTAEGPANIDLRDEMNQISFRVGLRMLFGRQEISTETIKKLCESAILMKNIIHYNPFRVFLGKEKSLPGLGYIRFIKAKRRYNHILRQLISVRIAQGHSSSAEEVFLIDHLLTAVKNNPGFTEETFETELFTLAFAITISTAVALQWMWVLFDQHREVAHLIRKMTKEAIVEDSDKSTQTKAKRFESLCTNEVIRACIKEVLRLYPPFWYQGRKAISADSYAGLSIEKNTNILINVLMLHRSPQLWDNPNSFDHTRFLGSAEKLIPEGAYIPFGAGARKCPADHMASMEMAIVATGLIKDFNVVIQNPVSLRATKESDLLLESEYPILAQISQIENHI